MHSSHGVLVAAASRLPTPTEQLTTLGSTAGAFRSLEASRLDSRIGIERG